MDVVRRCIHAVEDTTQELPINTAFHPLYEHFDPLIPQEAAREQLDIPVSPKLVLFFGLIRPYKGLEWLLQAATELHKNGEDVCFCIAGEPYTDWEPYQRIIDASPAPERFHNHLKFIPKEDVHVFFSAADLVCLPYAALLKAE